MVFEQGQANVDFRNGDASVSDNDVMENVDLSETTSELREAQPALPMTEKSDAGSAALVDKLGAEALAGALTQVA